MKIVDTMAKRPPRRKYSDQLKSQVVQEYRRRGASVAGVALSHAINASRSSSLLSFMDKDQNR
jgi:transposase-like protein